MPELKGKPQAFHIHPVAFFEFINRPLPYNGNAVIYTYQDMDYLPRDDYPKEGYTVFYDHFGTKLFSFTTGSRVDSSSELGASDPFTATFTYIEGGYRTSNCGKSYGTTKIRSTDPRGRWIHGGGGSTPFIERQGWRVTRGCTRAQNIDVETLASKIREFQKQYPDVKILMIRDRKKTLSR